MNSGFLKKSFYAALLLAFAGPVWSPAAAADPVPAQLPAPLPAPEPATTVPGAKLTSNFTDFAGSTENAASLVHGLRTGSPITLTDPLVIGGPPPVSTTFTPPTKPMGYGNVRIALSLAEAQLASEGITNPTATELQGALMGTTVTGPGGTTTTDGVLQMRASGIGWGKIANTMGYKLGPVMSGRQTFVAPTPTPHPTPIPTPHTTKTGSSVTTAAGVAGAGATAGRGKGIVTGTGAAASGGNKHVVTAAGGAPGSGNAGKGVTTGAGHAAHGHSSGITTGLGHASANASGAVTAAGGGKAGGNPNSHAGGNGKGGGKP